LEVEGEGNDAGVTPDKPTPDVDEPKLPKQPDQPEVTGKAPPHDPGGIPEPAEHPTVDKPG